LRKLNTEELNRLNTAEYKQAEKKPIIIVLDDIRSLNNIGSIFRTADAFRIEGIYLCGITACPPHREIHKTALGATDSVDWKYFEDIATALSELKRNSYTILAAEQTDQSIYLNNFLPEKNQKYALIFGNEVNGISTQALEFADVCIEIPQQGTKHSLNVTISVGIILWDILLKLNELH
jgi:tRNA G18 (ribose-2'-O)-methylase SpoU